MGSKTLYGIIFGGFILCSAFCSGCKDVDSNIVPASPIETEDKYKECPSEEPWNQRMLAGLESEVVYEV